MNFLKNLVNRGPGTLLKSRKQAVVHVVALFLSYLEVDKQTIAYIYGAMQSLSVFLMSVEKNVKTKNGRKK